MAERTDHVIVRDGRAGLGGPRPPVPERPSKGPAEAESGVAKFGGYGDRSYVGTRDERRNFEAAQGSPSPRQRLARGEKQGLVHQEPGDADIAAVTPLT